ncbi:DNA-binding transcriptional activator GcvA [Chromobacterium violaceum]|uniref:DNA-binding transcriptional activator GcvA n=1 Tax=Chromobacterium violaceum TaxID=536 RepID=A0A447TE20_CHRVL|nr:DNA-binding transcriptional activator GcvA [Chromobacterium violaceum]
MIANATSQLLQPNRQRRLTINSTPPSRHSGSCRGWRLRSQLPELELHLVTSDRDLSRLDAPFDVAIRRGPGDWPAISPSLS